MLNKKNQKLNLIFKIEDVKSFYEIKFGGASLLLYLKFMKQIKKFKF